jgi:hypothetical protein
MIVRIQMLEDEVTSPVSRLASQFLLRAMLKSFLAIVRENCANVFIKNSPYICENI